MTAAFAPPAQARGTDQKQVPHERPGDLRRTGKRHPEANEPRTGPGRATALRAATPAPSNHRSAAAATGPPQPHLSGANHRQAGPLAGPVPPRGGRPLPAALRARLAPVVGHQAAEAARVHTGPDAHACATANLARAVASGADIFFADGQYRPGTRAGDWLIAHEVAHVAQAQQGQLHHPAFLAVASAVRTPVESAANQAADRVIQDTDADTGNGQPQPPASGPTLAQAVIPAAAEGAAAELASQALAKPQPETARPADGVGGPRRPVRPPRCQARLERRPAQPGCATFRLCPNPPPNCRPPR